MSFFLECLKVFKALLSASGRFDNDAGCRRNRDAEVQFADQKQCEEMRMCRSDRRGRFAPVTRDPGSSHLLDCLSSLEKTRKRRDVNPERKRAQERGRRSGEEEEKRVEEQRETEERRQGRGREYRRSGGTQYLFKLGSRRHAFVVS
ncbi:hypothetical protein TGCAST_232990 [Toxoplasma gondii CAST]|uniref:Uncharacterized protein n=1 Tax=Toxoplasma gondii CAST TaxID=943122 RepID=A0A425I9V5_TOXGO|nr:hypothetical protein TGCAST_232990 [Toxoplasma gondii CAST]